MSGSEDGTKSYSQDRHVGEDTSPRRPPTVSANHHVKALSFLQSHRTKSLWKLVQKAHAVQDAKYDDHNHDFFEKLAQDKEKRHRQRMEDFLHVDSPKSSHSLDTSYESDETYENDVKGDNGDVDRVKFAQNNEKLTQRENRIQDYVSVYEITEQLLSFREDVPFYESNNWRAHLKDSIADVGSTGGTQREKYQSRAKRASVISDTATVEILMVIDFSLYEWWSSLSNDLEMEGFDTMHFIQNYYGYVFQGVDERLQSIAAPGIAINAAFAGLYVATSAEESFWTTTSVLEDESDSQRQMVNASEALEKFQMWLDNSTELPDYDHAILFTGTNLTYAGSSGNTGLAFGSSMCRNISNSSIVEDQLDIRTITFATQQVARSLGSNDDMDNNDCLEFFNYIMAPKLRLPVRSFSSNRWQFSACSQQYMKNYLAELKTVDLDCLYKSYSQSRYPEGISFVNEALYGSVTSAKRQCQIKFGATSDICRLRIGTGYNKICSGLLCALSDEETCDYILPADGTPCGDRKYCWQGTCQEFEDGIETSDTCVFGDDPNVACKDIILNNASLCYKETFRYSCCQTCESLALDNPGCEYGDRRSDCGLQDCVYGEENFVRITCCQTCSNGPTPYAPPLEKVAPEIVTPLQLTSNLPTSDYSVTLSSASTTDATSLKFQTEPTIHMLTSFTQNPNTVQPGTTVKGEDGKLQTATGSTTIDTVKSTQQRTTSTKRSTLDDFLSFAGNSSPSNVFTTHRHKEKTRVSQNQQTKFTFGAKENQSCTCQTQTTVSTRSYQTNPSRQATVGPQTCEFQGDTF